MKRSGVILDLEALYDLAQTRNEVDALEHNIFALYLLYRGTFDVRRLLFHERMSVYDKIEVMKQFPCFEPCTVFYDLLELLFEHDMIEKIYYVLESFNKVVTKRLNRMMVQVYSAVLLSDSLRREIKQKLATVFDKQIMLKNTVDPSIIGGIIVKLPNGKIFNFSYSKALSEIKYALMEKG